MTSKWKILAPIDLSRPTAEDVQYAFCVAAAFGADLDLLYMRDAATSEGSAPL